jgi:amidase
MHEHEYLAHDACSLATLVRSGSVSPAELVEVAIRRTERLNPRLNVMVWPMFDEARRRATSVARDGRLAGVPMFLKDLLTWYEGSRTTSGSRMYRDFLAPCDTEVARRLKAAGAIVLGKTNTPELGLTPFCESELLGIARNPWNPERTTGGSSGGSGAAVAAGLVPIAGGGDGGGSIRIPASCNGVFGLKPTRGRVPTGPLAGEHWQGAAIELGLSRSVRDSALLLDVIGGSDSGAPYQTPPPVRPYLEEVTREPRPLRIGVTTTPILGHHVHDDCVRAVTDARTLLESLGHATLDVEVPVERSSFNRNFVRMICAEVAGDLEDASEKTGRSVRRRDVEAGTWALALLGRASVAPSIVMAKRNLQRAARKVGQFFESIDALLTPTVAGPPFPHGALQPSPLERALLAALGAIGSGRLLRAAGMADTLADRIFDWIPFTPLFNVTGQPAMSVPLSWNGDGLPIGVQLVSRFGDEATLFQLAGQLERARPWRDRWPAIAAPLDP